MKPLFNLKFKISEKRNMAVAEAVKDKIVSVLGLIVVLIAVAQMLPTLKDGLATITPDVPILSFGLIGMLVGIGLIIFVVEAVF
jgi:hypothetical protein